MHLQSESDMSSVRLGCNNFMKRIASKYSFMKSDCQVQNKLSILMWMQIFGFSVNADIHQVLLLFSFKKDKREQNANLEGYPSYSHFCCLQSC